VVAGTWLTGGGTTGSVTLNATTQRGKDAVKDLAMNNSGTVGTTNTTALQAFFNGLGTNGSPELHFPCGTYYFNAPVITNAALITMIGDGFTSNSAGNGCVQFVTDQAINEILWFDNPGSSTNPQSARMEHIQFSDTSTNHNLLKSGFRITNQSNFYLNDISGFNLKQSVYTTGTVSITQGSKSVTGSGTTWTSSMVPGFMWVAGYPYEIASVGGTTSITLATAYQGTTNSSATYSIDSGGILMWLDPGLSLTQNGTVLALKSNTVSVPVYTQSGSSTTTVNHVQFLSGQVSCSALVDSIGAYFGQYSNSMQWSVTETSCAIGAMVASGRSNIFLGAQFDTPTIAPITTCSGGVATQSCIKGLLILSDNSTNTQENQVVENKFGGVGNAIELAGISANPPTNTKVGFNSFFSNTANCVFGNATATQGECDSAWYQTTVNGRPLIAATQVTTGTTTVNAGTCTANLGPVTVGGTPLAVSFTGTTDTSGSTGYGSVGGLQINAWPGTNAFNYKICNPTGSNITPSSVTWNVTFQ